MESLGDLLKQTRLNQNLSLEKVVEDTHIVRKFIEAIENEEFSIFPGEAYLRGFLRTYSEYLGLDPNEIIRMFEKIKIVETPTPMEQLIPKPKINYKPILIILIIIVCIVIISIPSYILIKNLSKNIGNIKISSKEEKKVNTKEKKTTNVKTTEEKIYNLVEQEKTIESIKQNEKIVFNIGSEKHTILVKEISPTVILKYGNDKEIFLIQNYQHKIDFNNDQQYDLLIILNNWDNKSANITIKQLNFKDNKTISTEVSSDITQSSSQYENIEKIITKPFVEEIQFNISFKDDSFIRYKIDDNQEIEGIYKIGTSINIRAKKYVILWLSNAGIVNLDFINYNKNIIPGESGKIEVKQIKWIQNNSGEFDLQIISLK